MNNQLKLNNLFTGTLIFSIVILLNGCLSINKLYVQPDVVNNSKNVIHNFEYIDFYITSSNPLYSANHTFVKQIFKNGQTLYKLYDVLLLNSNSFTVDNNVYIIIDNQPFKLNPESKEHDYIKSITANESEVATSDSTVVKVVTGYTETGKKVTRFTYTLPQNIVDKIAMAKTVSFQYYSGPHVITTKIKKRNLKKLKKLIDIN